MEDALSPISTSNAASPPPQQPQEESQQPAPAQPSGVKYVCGDCGTQILLQPNDPVRCPRCGYRILYKMRTKRLIQFEAR